MEKALTISAIQGVRGYVDEKGTVWLNVEDVARGLGFTQVAKSGNVVIRWERVNNYLREFGFIPTSGDSVKAGDYIPENMFYRLAMKASNAAAQKFQAKVCDEILPSIRKTGMYINPLAPIDPRFLRRIADELEARDQKIAELQPKADYCVKVLESKEHLTSELIAKEYGETAEWLHEKLKRLDKIYKRGKHWYMKAPYAKAGYRDSETLTLERGLTVVNHFWTQKGRNFIYDVLKKSGIVPVAERESMMAELL